MLAERINAEFGFDQNQLRGKDGRFAREAATPEEAKRHIATARDNPTQENVQRLVSALNSMSKDNLRAIKSELGLTAGGSKSAMVEKIKAQAIKRLSVREEATREARKAGIKPVQAMFAVAGEMRHAANHYVDEIRACLKDARATHGKLNQEKLTRRHKAFEGGDHTQLKGFDETARVMAGRYPEILGAHGYGEGGDASERLFKLLQAGEPPRMSYQESYGKAIKHLAANWKTRRALPTALSDNVPFANENMSDVRDAILEAADENPDLLDVLQEMVEDDEVDGAADEDEADEDDGPVDAGALASVNEWVRARAGEDVSDTGADEHPYLLALADAAKQVERNPTPAQKEANNYKLGHVKIHGLDISIEVPQGGVRTGVNKEGVEWRKVMPSHYGYLKKTQSDSDGDHVDVFVGNDPANELVHIVDQYKPNGDWDEHKSMIGYPSLDDAKQAYKDSYDPSWKGMGAVTTMPIEQFKKWIKTGDTSKPLAPRSEFSEDVLVGLQKAFGEIEDRAGIDIFYHEGPPKLLLIDVADWGNEDEAKRFANLVKRRGLIRDSEKIIWQNEGAKPQSKGWVELKPTEFAATTYWRYECPLCGSPNAFSGIRATGITFRGGAQCEDCGETFSAIHRQPIEKDVAADAEFADGWRYGSPPAKPRKAIERSAGPRGGQRWRYGSDEAGKDKAAEDAEYEKGMTKITSDDMSLLVGCLGKNITKPELARLVGAQPGDDFYYVRSQTRRFDIGFKSKDGLYEAMRRIIFSEPPAKPLLSNESFLVQDRAQGSGIGTRMLVTQVAQAVKLGIFSKITTEAAGSGDGTLDRKSYDTLGYYAWARLGYDGDISKLLTKNNHTGRPVTLPSEYANAKTIHELFAMKGGAEEWYKHGRSWDGHFDLKEGSKSRQILAKYAQSKGVKADFSVDANLVPGAICSPEDEAILDRIWQQIVEQGWDALGDVEFDYNEAEERDKNGRWSSQIENVLKKHGADEQRGAFLIDNGDNRFIRVSRNEYDKSAHIEYFRGQADDNAPHDYKENNKDLQVGTLSMMRKMIGVINDIGAAGVPVTYDAEPKRASANRRMFERLGWTPTNVVPMTDETKSVYDKWTPPAAEKIDTQPVAVERLEKAPDGLWANIKKLFGHAQLPVQSIGRRLLTSLGTPAFAFDSQAPVDFAGYNPDEARQYGQWASSASGGNGATAVLQRNPLIQPRTEGEIFRVQQIHAMMDKRADKWTSQATHLPEEKRAYYSSVLKDVFKHMTVPMLQHIARNVQTTVFYANTKAAGKLTGGMWAYNAATFKTNKGELHLDGGREIDPRFPDFTRQIYAHELGHALDGHTSISHKPDWLHAFATEINLEHAPLSAYARKNPAEGFAEFMRAFVEHPRDARVSFPLCYQCLRTRGLV